MSNSEETPVFGEVKVGQTFMSEGQRWVKVGSTLARPVLRFMLGDECYFEELSDIESIEQPRGEAHGSDQG